MNSDSFICSTTLHVPGLGRRSHGRAKPRRKAPRGTPRSCRPSQKVRALHELTHVAKNLDQALLLGGMFAGPADARILDAQG